ncbi:hypothetical protein GW17_00002704 [Ensete ventricosum]|nr:hypothetical protein GW17_00002704 [Ensete ventricosum]
MSWENLTHAKINLLLRKHNQCQDKFAMVEAQDHMRPRCVMSIVDEESDAERADPLTTSVPLSSRRSLSSGRTPASPSVTPAAVAPHAPPAGGWVPPVRTVQAEHLLPPGVRVAGEGSVQVGAQRASEGLRGRLYEALVAVLGYLYNGRVAPQPRDFLVEVLFASYTFEIPELVNLFQVRLLFPMRMQRTVYIAEEEASQLKTEGCHGKERDEPGACQSGLEAAELRAQVWRLHAMHGDTGAAGNHGSLAAADENLRSVDTTWELRRAGILLMTPVLASVVRGYDVSASPPITASWLLETAARLEDPPDRPKNIELDGYMG